MKNVFLLQHSYDQEGCDETKTIGIFSTRIKAELAIKDYQKLPVFKDYYECFFIDEYTLDVREWKEGFGSMLL